MQQDEAESLVVASLEAVFTGRAGHHWLYIYIPVEVITHSIAIGSKLVFCFFKFLEEVTVFGIHLGMLLAGQSVRVQENHTCTIKCKRHLRMEIDYEYMVATLAL